MKLEAQSPDQYIEMVPEERKPAMKKLRQVIQDNLPEGFTETITYGMIGYVVPHSLYPKGYHSDPKQPLPFMNIASQKNFIALYHMGLYSNSALLDWFKGEYAKHFKAKLDMGKGCLRFKKAEDIPFDLIGELSAKISVTEWIKRYESARKK
jgi:uncharacterized protein YdhG (YjbR/CyaY superfamily)